MNTDSIIAKLARPSVESKAKNIARGAVAVAAAALLGHLGGMLVVVGFAVLAAVSLALPRWAQRKARS